MKFKFIIFTLLVIFLVSCTTVTVRNNVKDITSKETVNEETPITRDDSGIVVDYEKVEYDIVIENTQLHPNIITIPLGNETELIIQNNDNLTYRLEIQLYGSEKQREIYPYEAVILKLKPTIKGFTPIKLGEFTLGTIQVE